MKVDNFAIKRVMGGMVGYVNACYMNVPGIVAKIVSNMYAIWLWLFRHPLIGHKQVFSDCLPSWCMSPHRLYS